jgi:hypothetical protein
MNKLNSLPIHGISKSLTHRAKSMALGVSLLCASFTCNLMAQSPENVATGLLRPAKIVQSQLGNLLVAEVGTAAPNTSRISIVDASGNRRTLIDGLPSKGSEILLV